MLNIVIYHHTSIKLMNPKQKNINTSFTQMPNVNRERKANKRKNLVQLSLENFFRVL